MGITLHNRIIFGIPCSRSVFWTDTGKQLLVCSADINHSVPERANFRVECGTVTREVSIEVPAERFRHICLVAKKDPGHVFNALRQGGWEWSSDDGSNGGFKVSWTSASSFVSAASEDNTETNMIIGIVVAEDAPGEDANVLAVDPYNTFGLYRTAMNEIGVALGLVDAPMLYFQTDVAF